MDIFDQKNSWTFLTKKNYEHFWLIDGHFRPKKIAFLTPNPNEQAHSHVLARFF